MTEEKTIDADTPNKEEYEIKVPDNKKSRRGSVEVKVEKNVEDGVTEVEIETISDYTKEKRGLFKKADYSNRDTLREETSIESSYIEDENGNSLSVKLTEKEFSREKFRDDELVGAQYTEDFPTAHTDAAFKRSKKGNDTVVAARTISDVHAGGIESMIDQGAKELDRMAGNNHAFEVNYDAEYTRHGNPNSDSFMQAVDDYKAAQKRDDSSKSEISSVEDGNPLGIADPVNGMAVGVAYSSERKKEDFVYRNSGLGHELNLSAQIKKDRATMVYGFSGKEQGYKGQYDEKTGQWNISEMSPEEVKKQMKKDKKKADDCIQQATRNAPDKYSSIDEYKADSINMFKVEENPKKQPSVQEIARMKAEKYNIR